MGKLVENLLQGLEQHLAFEERVEQVRQEYLERNPGEATCVVCLMAPGGPSAALYVGPLIRKQRQQPLS